MLRITVTHHSAEMTVEIPSEFAPALRSAVNEQRNELGSRLSGVHVYTKEDALTRAAAAFATLAKAINHCIPEDDNDYE